MGMLAERADYVIGVDTHRDSHSAAAVVAATGIVTARATVAADAFGYRRLLRLARRHARGRRLWAVESSGSFGAGLSAFLLGHGEWVVEVERPKRPARRNGAKSDELDAVRAAHEALERDHLAQPRARGEREAVRVLLVTRRSAIRARTQAINHLKALVITAHEPLRHQLRNTPTAELVERCSRLRTLPSHEPEHRATVLALRHTARRIRALDAEANDLACELAGLVERIVPDLLAETGIGPISAAQLYCSWSHRGRLRNDGAFAMLGGSAPIPASSGQTIRHRLNRAGDRQLNCALHTIVLTRLQHDPATRAYAARRTAEGKTPREIKRCLKRYLARRVFRILETTGPHPATNQLPRSRAIGHCS
jgi:transposase